MYNLFLALAVLLVISSPLFLDLYLSAREARFERRRASAQVQAKGPSIAWASSRL